MLDSYRYPTANRPVAMGVNGMVSSAHPLASLAGVQVMAEGGNAFDAVVAVASTLNVVEPYMSGVGGIGLALAHVASEGRVRALNFSGRMPRAATPDKFTTESLEQGILAPLIPGNLAGWLTLHETYGTMDRERLFRQAISYAENGFPITFVNSEIMHQTAEHLRRFPKSAQTILDGSGAAHPPGTRLVWPDLARTLTLIAKQGAEVFYRGEIAEGIVKASEEMNGLFTMDDLADYETEWQDPISVEYNGYRIYTTPPNSSGFQVLQTLKMMEGSEPRYQSVDTLHRFMESVKLAVTDRIEWAGDPDYVTAPLAGLLSDDYAASQRDRIDMATASKVRGERYADPSPDNPLRPGDPVEFEGGMTTHFAVADRDGNVVSVTQTLGGGFGSSVIAGDTGVFLNNMGSYFELADGNSNQIGPWKRVDFVVAPTQTFKDGKFHLSIGTPGGYGILQTTPQMLMNVLDYGMNVQQAIEAPRFKYTLGTHVVMEERFPWNVRRALELRGHEVDVVESFSRLVGGAQGIQVDQEQGTFQGGADPRRDGVSLGF
ncbi:MAG: gamma-glutamyltransferase [Chloroflexota bacterium]|nr:gamma-glutamyltransferase [Chloroflexota bacterium]